MQKSGSKMERKIWKLVQFTALLHLEILNPLPPWKNSRRWSCCYVDMFLETVLSWICFIVYVILQSLLHYFFHSKECDMNKIMKIMRNVPKKHFPEIFTNLPHHLYLYERICSTLFFQHKFFTAFFLLHGTNFIHSSTQHVFFDIYLQ